MRLYDEKISLYKYILFRTHDLLSPEWVSAISRLTNLDDMHQYTVNRCYADIVIFQTFFPNSYEQSSIKPYILHRRTCI